MLCVLWSIPALYALSFYLPFNAAQMSLPRTRLLLFTPQGWGFFTRDPRETDTFTYYRSSTTGEWTLTGRRALSLGFGRLGAAVLREAATYAFRSTPAAITCRADHIACLESAREHKQRLKAVVKGSYFCGDLGFVWQDPVPWAWAHLDGVIMPSHVAWVVVEC